MKSVLTDLLILNLPGCTILLVGHIVTLVGSRIVQNMLHSIFGLLRERPVVAHQLVSHVDAGRSRTVRHLHYARLLCRHDCRVRSEDRLLIHIARPYARAHQSSHLVVKANGVLHRDRHLLVNALLLRPHTTGRWHCKARHKRLSWLRIHHVTGTSRATILNIVGETHLAWDSARRKLMMTLHHVHVLQSRAHLDFLVILVLPQITVRL